MYIHVLYVLRKLNETFQRARENILEKPLTLRNFREKRVQFRLVI